MKKLLIMLLCISMISTTPMTIYADCAGKNCKDEKSPCGPCAKKRQKCVPCTQRAARLYTSVEEQKKRMDMITRMIKKAKAFLKKEPTSCFCVAQELEKLAEMLLYAADDIFSGFSDSMPDQEDMAMLHEE